MDRNEILANFQACTGIDDIGECIAHLEQCNWSMNDAVSVALAARLALPPEDHSTVPSLFHQYPPQVSNSRMINFDIRMGTMTKQLSLDETANLSELRQLASVEFGITKKEAKFSGWPDHGTDHMSDDTDLRSLHLPKNVSLNIQTDATKNGATSSSFTDFAFKDNVSVSELNREFAIPCPAKKISDEFESLKETFKIDLLDKRSGKTYRLSLVGSKTFGELRRDAHSLTGTPPSKQIWEELTSDPEFLTPDRTLGSLKLNTPVHKCSVSSKVEERASTSSFDQVMDDEQMEIDEATESISDDFLFTYSPASASSRPLMPDEATDDVGALSQFQSEFNDRYGKEAQVTPNFFLDSLDVAIQEAFGGQARDRRVLAVYLHNDKSIQSNVFCSQLLCAPTVVEFMASHCVVWAWDVTSDFNRKRLLDMCARLLGSGVADTVKRVPKDGFPMLVLAQGRGRSCEVNSIIQGNTSLDELMVKLIKAVDDAEIQKQDDVKKEEISEARNRIKREQEEAYQESLMRDMEKQKKIDDENAELERQQQELERIEREKNKEIEKLTQIVPAEPEPNCGKPIARIRFRPPGGGDMVTRTFLASEKLQGLLNFVGSLGYLSTKYRVITTYPKRDVSSFDPQKSLADHKLVPQETLIIEERVE